MLEGRSQGRTKFLINPVSGRGLGRRLAPRIRNYLHQAGLRSSASFSRAPGDIARQVQEACAQGAERIIIAGGDGSVFEAVNGIMNAGGAAALGIIPVGTGNDFIKVVGTPREWRAACDRLLAGQVRQVDIGRCNSIYFANGLGAGFDAMVTRLARELRWLRGNTIYMAALARALWRGIPTPEVKLECDGQVLHQQITLVAAANGQCYGGKFHIAPLASIEDGLLDVILADGLDRRGALRLVPKVMRGTHLDSPAVRHWRTRRLVLSSEAPLPLQMDGEIIDTGDTRLEIDILPQRLSLIV